jgi:hypothetical protein
MTELIQFFIKRPYFLPAPFIIFFILLALLIRKPKPEPPAPEPPPPTQAEIMMTALSKAYPDRIGQAQFINEDWAFQIGETWFYYSDGRILPEDLKEKAYEYGATRFYTAYAAGMPWNPPIPDQPSWGRSATAGRGVGAARSGRRHQHFFEALWGISSREEASKQMKEVEFLKHTVKIHGGIEKQLAIVEKLILSAAESNPAVQKWIDSLGLVDAWNWRNVASSGNRSFHSYGIAIDLLPKNLGGQATYWLWTSQHTPEWWKVPYNKRYHPPDEVVLAFESAGFIWGGKWPYYDTMHFEYHPEVFVLNDIPLLLKE